MTPFEKLKSLPDVHQHLRPGVTLCALEDQARAMSDVRRVQYQWHPLCGEEVVVVGKVGGRRNAYRCRRRDARRGISLEIPLWMFDPVLCSQMRRNALTAPTWADVHCRWRPIRRSRSTPPRCCSAASSRKRSARSRRRCCRSEVRLSWNEVRVRAAAFATEWCDAEYEKGETHSFYNEFFEVFGVRRRTVARYEEHVQKLDDRSGFILGVERRVFRDQDPANIEAAELVGRVPDALAAAGYAGHDLERFLVRLVFCLFADDTGIFEPRDILFDLLESRTSEDGAWLLSQLFEVLNTPAETRQATLDEDLARFPYVNGDLFDGPLAIPSFDAQCAGPCWMRAASTGPRSRPRSSAPCSNPSWLPRRGGAQGAHYTTEKNILKVIEPLFLDDLRAEFKRLRARKDGRRRTDLLKFQRRLGELAFFDPACGCGNFLIIAYRELRTLELEVLKELYAGPMLETLADLHANSAPEVTEHRSRRRSGDELGGRIATRAVRFRVRQSAVCRRQVPVPGAAGAGAPNRRSRQKRRHAGLRRGLVPAGGGVRARGRDSARDFRQQGVHCRLKALGIARLGRVLRPEQVGEFERSNQALAYQDEIDEHSSAYRSGVEKAPNRLRELTVGLH